MAQHMFYNDLRDCVRMDEPIPKGTIPRLQRKILDVSNTSISNMNNSLNISKNNKLSTSVNGSFLKSPNKRENKKTPSKTPKKTPKKSPGCRSNSATTPGKGPKTPNGGDRFIPSRSATDIELCHYKICDQGENEELLSPSQKEIRRIMSENLQLSRIHERKILACLDKAPEPPQGFQNPMKVIYSNTKSQSSSKCTNRYIPHAPERILDAPEILDDYYLNLLDWSQSNLLAVALNNTVYLWNATTGSVDQLVTLEGADYVCSVAWMPDSGSHLAIGNSLGVVQLWDCTAVKKLRTMQGHMSRVSSLSWNSYVVSSGSRLGQINHYDVRSRDHLVAQLSGHSQEVCGLKWSPDGKYLASGGNDNMLYIWPVASREKYSQTQYLHGLSQHMAAVKALSWCPWQPNVLASGGGTADRCIRFWNCNNGNCFNTVDTKSQVCSIQWSVNYKEIISGHGFANNQLIIWKYPTMTKVTELIGHTSRVLHLAMSPDGSTVLSAGADETLRLWKCFVPDKAKKKLPCESEPILGTFSKGIR